jgi:hypothetical protein
LTESGEVTVKCLQQYTTFFTTHELRNPDEDADADYYDSDDQYDEESDSEDGEQ